ncbi:MAG: hypothetical protein COT17_03335 [Elusimicrobia bacterium CG08_land_8_20_14_0_20_51_18]|nr:MAG: hypothetical protein COT17_03335 [Elusimicrobia bacterium CG08_land_8_20_14_0_20_51_18]
MLFSYYMEPFKKPARCIIETDYKCNLKCQSCSLWKEDYRKLRGEGKGALKTEELEVLHEKLAAFGVKRTTYIGGEPFLNEDILKLALDAKAKGIIPNTVTNGNALTREAIKEITGKGLFNTMIFSLDGPKNIHNFIRGSNDAFQKVFEALKTLRGIKAQKKLKYPKLFVYVTVSKLNYKYLEEAYRLAKSVNANRIRFQLASALTPEILAETNKILGFEAVKTHSYLNALGLAPEELEKAKKTLRKIKAVSKNGLKIETESVLDGTENKNCRFIGRDFVITPSGNVLLCPMLTNFTAGNVKTENLQEIFSKNMKKTGMILALADSGKLPVCRQCCVEKII